MIDTHAHLGDDAAEVLARARAAGVTRVVTVATTLRDAHHVLAQLHGDEIREQIVANAERVFAL